MTAPEFSHPVRVDTIGEGERHVAIAAGPAERAALARRFDLKAVEAITGAFTLRRDAAGVIVRGRVVADVVQACVVTDDPVPATIDEAVALRFVAAAAAADDEEVELDSDALDTLAFDSASLDLGEVAAETMALALDPYPRAPGAAEALRRHGVIGEEEAGPFGVLAGLRDKLGQS